MRVSDLDIGLLEFVIDDYGSSAACIFRCYTDWLLCVAHNDASIFNAGIHHQGEDLAMTIQGGIAVRVDIVN